jgi:hypothetical protein
MYDETKQKSLFEKFDRVAMQPVKQEVALPGADLEFCKQVQEEFDKMVESLDHFQALYEEFQKSRPAEKLVKLNLETFCPVADFREKKQESKQAFVNAVFRYFQDKYYLEEVDLSALCENEKLDYKRVADKILAEFGELDSYGITRIKNDFKTKFCTIYASCPGEVPVLKNNKITIPHMFWYETSWNGEKSIGYQYEDDIALLKRTISFFETGVNELIDFNLPISGYSNKLQFNEPYETGLNKLTALKFYKNRRVDLIFKTAANAGEFFAMFDMAHPYDYSRR